MVDKNDYGVHPRYQILNLIPVSSKSIYLIIKGLFNNDIEGLDSGGTIALYIY